MDRGTPVLPRISGGSPRYVQTTAAFTTHLSTVLLFSPLLTQNGCKTGILRIACAFNISTIDSRLRST